MTSVTVLSALKKAGKAAEQVELAYEDHLLSKGATQLQALQAIYEFVKKNI